MTLRFLSFFLASGLFLPPFGLSGQELAQPSPGSSGSISLPEAIELAQEYHPVIGEARAQRRVAAGVLGQARASWLPSLYSDASIIRHQEPMLVAPLHGFDPTMAPDFDRSLVRGNLTVGFTLFEGGARRARIDGAEAGENSAAHGYEASRMNLAIQVSGAFLGVLTSVELLDAASTRREALEAEEVRVQQFLSEGKAARVDLLRVQASLSQAEAVEISIRSQLDVARARLSRLTGLSPDQVRDQGLADVALKEPPMTDVSRARLRAREASPDLGLARQRLAGAEAGVREAKAGWLPTVRVAGAYSEFGALAGDHTQEWQGALQFSYPLFTGGAREGERQRAVGEEQRASEALRSIELAVDQEVEEAMASIVETQARVEALERAVEQAAEVARIEALALEVGAGVQTEFLRAQSELFQSQAALAEARHGGTMAVIQLVRVTGELTLAWVKENMEVVR
ncbi:MAG: TolC family protein [Gemmatimonadetes bacterium]|nr:TolC family protein [Gemmatimonadota bacterium]NNM04234.1 TolC family protein [Gemmatimonadota bacterium]